jgi:hypothetical protein
MPNLYDVLRILSTVAPTGLLMLFLVPQVLWADIVLDFIEALSAWVES